jgi:hypothetical protein
MTKWPCKPNLLVTATAVVHIHSVQSSTLQDLSCLLFVRNRRARHKVSEAGNTSPPTRRGVGKSSCCKSPRTRSQLTTADTTPMCSCPSPSQTSSAKSSTRCYQKNSHECGQTQQLAFLSATVRTYCSPCNLRERKYLEDVGLNGIMLTF